jgi:exopolyphosphatase/guanosine-5'-triphosphate,3'-diphosphate pyrophosphatase
MKQAIIDIGSNSMRLTLFETDGTNFKVLFKEKIMAGIAGYVEDGILSPDGIECAYTGLLDFRQTLESLGIADVAVFATASLRNIGNTEEAAAAIKAATGYSVEVISGEDEASFGYIGAMLDVHVSDGAYIDIGGASTEIVPFEGGRPLASASFRVGSLNLYRECVKKIMPGAGSVKRMRRVISDEIDKKSAFDFDKRSPLVCVGGTARAVLKTAEKLCRLPAGSHTVTKPQFENICDVLLAGGRTASDLVLRLEPDRIHTMVPGVMIMQHIFKLFDASELVISNYGVREGYLCQRMLKSRTTNIHTPKTES